MRAGKCDETGAVRQLPAAGKRERATRLRGASRQQSDHAAKSGLIGCPNAESVRTEGAANKAADGIATDDVNVTSQSVISYPEPAHGA